MQITNRHEKILNPTNHQGNANQNHEISPHTCQNVIIKNLEPVIQCEVSQGKNHILTYPLLMHIYQI